VSKVNSNITHFNLFELQLSNSLIIGFQLFRVDSLQLIYSLQSMPNHGLGMPYNCSTNL